MIITLLTGKSYNLSDPEAFRRLLGKVHTLQARNKAEELTNIQSQVEISDIRGDTISTLYTKLGGDPEKLPIPKPVPMTDESGETSFQDAYAHLITDMAAYTNDIEHLITYSGIVLNMFIHAATYVPKEGHSKCQDTEIEAKSQLQYYRSQKDHPIGQLIAKLINAPVKTCSLPLNRNYETFHQASAYIQQAKKSKKNDYLKQSMKNFLNDYIINEKTLPLLAEVTEAAVGPACSSKVVDLLKNIIAYVSKFVAKLEFLSADEPLAVATDPPPKSYKQSHSA